MKTIGRGRDYQKALMTNLIKHVTTHKKITTTISRGKRVRQMLLKKQGGVVRITPIGVRQGDGAPQVLVEWREKVHEKNTVNKTKDDTTKVASV